MNSSAEQNKKPKYIDENFRKKYVDLTDVSFRECFGEPFCLHGLFKPQSLKEFRRMPREFETCAQLNEAARLLIRQTAGARLRFCTDSPQIAVSVILSGGDPVFPHIPATGSHGFDMYSRPAGSRLAPVYAACFIPHFEDDGVSYSGAHVFPTSAMREITIHFPLFAEVKELYIGLNDKAAVLPPSPYAVEKPVVFYGSSITQGGCASRPGNCYSAVLSRRLDFDYINLGFSGSARGDRAAAEYISELPMSAFVLDYDHNAVTDDMLRETHHAFYKAVREKNPSLPIIMMSAPVPSPARIVYKPDRSMENSRRIIIESFLKGKQSGDKNLYFIDGESLLGAAEAEDCLVDHVHPTDLGFRHMADRIEPVLKKVLYEI